MGLDMYAFSTADHPGSPTPDPEVYGYDDSNHIKYWRKHPNLHGWMERLFRAKGGTGVFNLQRVELTLDDLDALEQDVRANRLPFTTGFFFGESDGSEVDDDLEFIAAAREAIAAGRFVWYYSWW